MYKRQVKQRQWTVCCIWQPWQVMHRCISVSYTHLDVYKRQEVGTISMDQTDYLIEIYLKDDKLVCVYARTTDKTDSQGVIRSVPYTVAETFDVSDPANPKSLGEMSQSGSFHTMRVSGDYMYLLSTFYADISGPKDDISSYVPVSYTHLEKKKKRGQAG